MGIPRAWLALAVCAGCGGGGSPGGPDGPNGPHPDAGPPPTGAGISADYPGDIGIGSDPRVIFADDFESYGSATDLPDKWDDYYQQQLTRIATEEPNVYAGAQSLEFTMPVTTEEISNAVSKY